MNRIDITIFYLLDRSIFYENIGNATNPEFQFVTGQYLFMDMSDRTSPIVYDIDNDGLDELMVGIGSGDVVMLENSGTQTEPEFYFADTSYFNLTFPYNPELSFCRYFVF